MSDFKTRVVTEQEELLIKIEALENFLTNGDTKRVTEDQLTLLKIQFETRPLHLFQVENSTPFLLILFVVVHSACLHCLSSGQFQHSRYPVSDPGCIHN